MSSYQKTTHKKYSFKKIKEIIARDFSNAMLITLHCTAAVMVPPELAKKIFRGWILQARRIAGRTFRFIKIIDYGPHPIPEIVFLVVVDLPEGDCKKICDGWFMGGAFVNELDSDSFIKIADAIMREDSQTVSKRAHKWSYCGENTRLTPLPLRQ